MSQRPPAYYEVEKLQCYHAGQGPFTFVDTDLLNADTGEPIELFTADPALKQAKATTVDKHAGADRMPVFGTAWMLVSQRAHDAFQKVECCPSIRWVPTEVVGSKANDLGNFYLAYGACLHPVWDYSRSDCAWLPNKPCGTKEAVAYMREGVLDLTAVPKADLFQATHLTWIGSQRLREVIEGAALTGFPLKTILTSD